MQILIKPIITEKAMKAVQTNCYTFAVAKEANKHQIAQEIKTVFGFKPLTIKTITVPGKTKRSGKTRLEKKANSWKKAIIKLKAGEKIDLFDVTENVKQT